MGLTKSSTGNNLLNNDFFKERCDYTIAIAGNPNVGKSTIFNGLTGMHQHTGNWPGKTVSNASGICEYKNKHFLLIDIPGTYSLMSNSEEEEIARDYICFGNPDVTVVILDATCLERNLNLVYQTMEITNNIIVCVNLLDEAKKKGISIDLPELSNLLGVPVIGTTARKPKTLQKLLDAIYQLCLHTISSSPKRVTYSPALEDSIRLISSELCKIPSIPETLHRFVSLKFLDGEQVILSSLEKHLKINFDDYVELKTKIEEAQCLLRKSDIAENNFKDRVVSSILYSAEDVTSKVCHFENGDYTSRDRKIDKIITSKKFGIPIMIAFLGIIFWITIIGANYPSAWLSSFFGFLQEKLVLLFDYFHAPAWLKGILIDGMYQTLSWVVSVMLPPMAIFFPLFTIMEDLGYLPRIAFNLDNCFKKACTTGKQALTMCMGFGCNAAGVVGCRIIDSPRERLIATLTNNFVPCNGRFPFLITIATIFFAGVIGGIGSSIVSTLVVLLVIILGIIFTLLISKFLSKTILKGIPSSFVLELPPYRKPQFGKVFIRSIFDRTLFVLGRAICVAAPTGIVIWILANVGIDGVSLLQIVANFLDPFAKLMGLDGYILTAFILGLPANEIVLPIILMSYLGAGILVDLEDTFTISQILLQHGWTVLTAINVMLFTLLHFPCSTTLMTIKKETGSLKWTALSFLIPTVCGILVCMLTTFIWNIFV